jgi:AraC family transcriptional regulator of adaptative response/methylated-DNA-[protein]-cysteine methyltransferase
MSALLNMDHKIMEKAFYERDSTYDGLFYVAVKTTGIFCRITCTARKPKREHIEFFTSVKQALDHGYRPCKVCKPMEARGKTPEWVAVILAEVNKNPAARMRDRDIKAFGVDPARLRRWFKTNHEMTLQAYLRALRIGAAFGRIKLGEAVIDSAYDSGYESLSGFNDAFKKIFHSSPQKRDFTEVIKTTRITTSLGPMLAGATDEGVCLLEFIDRRMLETQIKRLSKRLRARFTPGINPHLVQLQQELDQYFSGARKQFSVPLAASGTEFQQKAWRILRRIPYGKTISYKEQAVMLRSSRSVRAVARANGDNMIAILIPCHRVIGSDGNLTGYGGGLWRKKYLLDLERKNSTA